MVEPLRQVFRGGETGIAWNGNGLVQLRFLEPLAVSTSRLWPPPDFDARTDRSPAKLQVLAGR